MEPFALKQDMLLGTASPATQCEGGEEESSWIYWWGLGNVRDNASPADTASASTGRRLNPRRDNLTTRRSRAIAGS